MKALTAENEKIRQGYAEVIQQLTKLYKRHKTLEDRVEAKIKRIADGEPENENTEAEGKIRKLVDIIGDGANKRKVTINLVPPTEASSPPKSVNSAAVKTEEPELEEEPMIMDDVYDQLNDLWETSERIPKLVFLPNGKIRLLHDFLFIFAMAYEICIVGLCFALDQWTDDIRDDELIGCSAGTALYCFTIFFNFRTARLDGWELIGDVDEEIPDLHKMYLKGWFKFDVFITVPFDLISSIWSAYAFRLLRCIRVARVARTVDLFQQSSPIASHPIGIRLLIFLFFYISGVHLLTCVWVRSDGAKNAETDPNPTSTDLYISGIYYVVTTMTTVGYGDILPTTVEHMLLSTFIMIVGAGSYGYVMGNFSRLLVRSDKLKKETDEKRHKIGAFMRHYGIPWSLQKKTFALFPSMIEKQVYDLKQVIGNLPPSLAMKLEIFIKIKLLRQTHFLCELPDKILLLLSDRLLTETVDAGCLILRQGTTGREMYIINRGAVEIFKREETTDPDTGCVQHRQIWLTNLREGQFFGEFALLGSKQRSVSVRSITACSLFILTLDAFDAVDKIYPELRIKLEQKINVRNAAVAKELKAEKQKAAGILASWKSKSSDELAEQKAARKWKKNLKDKLLFQQKRKQSQAAAAGQGLLAGCQPLPVISTESASKEEVKESLPSPVRSDNNIVQDVPVVEECLIEGRAKDDV